MSPLPHLVWDIGGVMYRYFTELVIDLGTEQGWPVGRIPLGPTGSVADPDYARMLSGEIDERGYVPLVMGRLRAQGIEFDPVADLDFAGQERPRTWDTIAGIHAAGHRQAVLTNDSSRWLGPAWWETWEHARWFDALLDVAELGTPRKPAPEPYAAAAAALGAPPDECLFVDDSPANCRGAEAADMRSHLFLVTDPVGSMERLEKRLGLAAGDRSDA